MLRISALHCAGRAPLLRNPARALPIDGRKRAERNLTRLELAARAHGQALGLGRAEDGAEGRPARPPRAGAHRRARRPRRFGVRPSAIRLGATRTARRVGARCASVLATIVRAVARARRARREAVGRVHVSWISPVQRVHVRVVLAAVAIGVHAGGRVAHGFRRRASAPRGLGGGAGRMSMALAMRLFARLLPDVVVDYRPNAAATTAGTRRHAASRLSCTHRAPAHHALAAAAARRPATTL